LKRLTIYIAGVHDFFIDTRLYYSVATDIWAGKPLKSFTRRELETYRQVWLNISVDACKNLVFKKPNSVVLGFYQVSVFTLKGNSMKKWTWLSKS